MFESIPTAPTDPILGLAELFYADNRPNKINLGIGVYKDETGKTPILISVKKAEKYLLENEKTKNYLNIEGLSDFAKHTQELLFNKNNILISTGRIYTAQTPGGTGALRIAADFLANQTKVKCIWLSNPSWPNHKNIFNAAGLEVQYYDYYDNNNHNIDFEGMLTSLKKAQAGSVVLFHACCHNPTGIDPTPEQWQQLAQLLQEKNLLPMFDCAYQGFANDLEKDTECLRIFADIHQELIIASSYSKNFGLYNERVGALTIVANNNFAKIAFSQIKYSIRANYSSPPAHGGAIVSTILSDKILRDIWEQELTNMRQRIKRMRYLFVKTLEENRVTKKKFRFIIKQNGMFSFSGLTTEQVMLLREKFGVYLVNSGRINIAGMTSENISILCNAMMTVLS